MYFTNLRLPNYLLNQVCLDCLPIIWIFLAKSFSSSSMLLSYTTFLHHLPEPTVVVTLSVCESPCIIWFDIPALFSDSLLFSIFWYYFSSQFLILSHSELCATLQLSEHRPPTYLSFWIFGHICGNVFLTGSEIQRYRTSMPRGLTTRTSITVGSSH